MNLAILNSSCSLSQLIMYTVGSCVVNDTASLVNSLLHPPPPYRFLMTLSL